jgi:hypothetical protein
MAMAEASFRASVMVCWLSVMVAKCDRWDMAAPSLLRYDNSVVDYGPHGIQYFLFGCITKKTTFY